MMMTTRLTKKRVERQKLRVSISCGNEPPRIFERDVEASVADISEALNAGVAAFNSALNLEMCRSKTGDIAARGSPSRHKFFCLLLNALRCFVGRGVVFARRVTRRRGGKFTAVLR